jgi:hypothetical protein
MIVGKGYQDFVDFCGHDGQNRPFTILEVGIYLLINNLTLGGVVDPRRIAKKEDNFFFHMDMNDTYICDVESEKDWVRKRGGIHTIVFDGGKVYDPNPETKRRELSEYNVISYMPIMAAMIPDKDKNNTKRDWLKLVKNAMRNIKLKDFFDLISWP